MQAARRFTPASMWRARALFDELDRRRCGCLSADDFLGCAQRASCDTNFWPPTNHLSCCASHVS